MTAQGMKDFYHTGGCHNIDGTRIKITALPTDTMEQFPDIKERCEIIHFIIDNNIVL